VGVRVPQTARRRSLQPALDVVVAAAKELVRDRRRRETDDRRGRERAHPAGPLADQPRTHRLRCTRRPKVNGRGSRVGTPQREAREDLAHDPLGDERRDVG